MGEGEQAPLLGLGLAMEEEGGERLEQRGSATTIVVPWFRLLHASNAHVTNTFQQSKRRSANKNVTICAHEAHAQPGRGANPYAPPVRVHHLLHKRQPQPCSPPPSSPRSAQHPLQCSSDSAPPYMPSQHAPAAMSFHRDVAAWWPPAHELARGGWQPGRDVDASCDSTVWIVRPLISQNTKHDAARHASPFQGWSIGSGPIVGCWVELTCALILAGGAHVCLPEGLPHILQLTVRDSNPGVLHFDLYFIAVDQQLC